MTGQAGWVFLALGLSVAYVYLGYPVLLTILSLFKPASPWQLGPQALPPVSIVIAAHNEERVIAEKIGNSLAVDYPNEKLQVIAVSDGSTDFTAEIASSLAGERLSVLDLPCNVGKASAQNRGVERATGHIVLFTDAEVSLAADAVRQLVRHFGTDRVGCVVGRVQYVNGDETTVSQGESAYWRYELLLRQCESRLGILAMGSGALMALRRSLFEPLDPAVSEDFVLPMTMAMRGFKTVYEPAAIAHVPLGQVHPRDMLRAKSRTVTLDTRGLFLCRGILNPFRYPLYSWGLISHKLLRWLVPYFLMALFAVNLLLLDQPFYRFTLAAQILWYALAGLGYLWQRTGRKPPRILGIPFSFCLVNAAAAVGVAQFLMGKKSGRWTPVREATPQ